MTLILIVVLILYLDDLLVIGDEPLMIRIRGRWIMKPKMMYQGMVN